MPDRLAVPTPADLARAAAIVRAHLSPTPLAESIVGQLKLECLQPTGSFKVRGALAALAQLSTQDHVVTASAGNHGLGVAYAAARLGVRATVVVPTTASSAKIAALREFPVRLVLEGGGYSDAERYALELAASGATYVSAYYDGSVIAGQASIGAELVVDGPVTIVAPVGGGGLVAGLSLWARDHPSVHVVGIEAAASCAVSAAVAAGRIVEVTVDPTLADGLAGNLEANSITPAIVAEHTHALATVTESEIRHAMRFLATRHGLLVEGSGAVAVAALLAGTVDVAGRAVAVVTGRNIALTVALPVLSEL